MVHTDSPIMMSLRAATAPLGATPPTSAVLSPAAPPMYPPPPVGPHMIPVSVVHGPPHLQRFTTSDHPMTWWQPNSVVYSQGPGPTSSYLPQPLLLSSAPSPNIDFHSVGAPPTFFYATAQPPPHHYPPFAQYQTSPQQDIVMYSAYPVGQQQQQQHEPLYERQASAAFLTSVAPTSVSPSGSFRTTSGKDDAVSVARQPAAPPAVGPTTLRLKWSDSRQKRPAKPVVVPPPAPGDDEPGPRQVIVNYLAATIDSESLGQLFEQYGEVEAVRVVTDTPSGPSRGYGFVYFKHHADAEKAIADASGRVLLGKRVRVSYAVPQRSLATFLELGGLVVSDEAKRGLASTAPSAS